MFHELTPMETAGAAISRSALRDLLRAEARRSVRHDHERWSITAGNPRENCSCTVFISSSSKDQAVALQVRDALEYDGIRCWIAPRDIRPGKSYPESIVEGIRACRVMILLLSNHSNLSKHVLREVEQAIANDSVVIPLRLEVCPLSDAMKYLIGAFQWIDMSQPLDGNDIERLILAVRAIDRS